MFCSTKQSVIFGAIALLAMSFCAHGAASKTAPTGKSDSGAKISLNFKDADIRQVAQSIGEIVGKDFILDPQVQGRVTVVSAKPISADAVYSVFLSVLEVHGFAAVPAGPVTKIIPALKAREVPGVSPAKAAGAPGDAMVTEVIPVENVPAAQLVPVLRPLMSTQASLASYQPANLLVMSDRVSNVKRIVRIIHRIDQSGSSNGVDIISLQYGSATDIVRVLGQLMQGTQQNAGTPVRLAADERTNSILIGGGQSDRLRVKALIAQLDTPRKQGGNTQVIYLHYAKAKDIAKVLKGFVDASEQLKKGKAAATSTSGGKAAILADEGTNSVVITAPPKMMREIKQVIDKLDIRRAEVFVQAIIAELNSDRSAELGITWAADALQNHGTAGLTNYSGTGTGIAQLAGAAAAGQAGLGGTSFGGTTGIGGAASVANAIPDGLTLAVGKIVKGGFSFAALLRALAGNSQTNILSAPSITTLDNEKAKITVGQQVPFVTGSYTNGGIGGTSGATGGLGGGFVNPFTTVNRQQVGITLEITPQINQGDTVSLKIHQTVSSIAGSSHGAVDLITNNREIQTSVIARNGQIIVLGGLMQNNLRESQQKVPVLGDIPLLGNLFKYRSSSNTKQNLLVFIRPTILRTPESVTYYTNAKYQFMRNMELSNKTDVSLMPDVSRPVLPPFNAIQKRPTGQTPTNSAPKGTEDASS